MKTDYMANIAYGELSLNFLSTESVSKFLSENGISTEMCFPKTQFFYQGILMKLGISHTEEKELDVVYHAIRLNGEGVSDDLESGFESFENFPIHVDDKIYFVDFGVKLK